jgi:hypothetical protein
MKHLLSLMTVCLLSLSAQAQKTWDFLDLSESIPLIEADDINWNVDKYQTNTTDVPIQWSNKIAFTEWSTLKANGEEIPATKGLMFIASMRGIDSLRSKKSHVCCACALSESKHTVINDNKCFIIVYILFLVTKNGANINKKIGKPINV